MPIFDKTNVNGGFLFKEAVCSNGREQVGDEVLERTMSGVFNLRDVLQLVIDRLYQGPFSQQDFVRHAYQGVLHVVLYFGYQLYAVKEKITKQGLSDILLVRTEFAFYVLQKLSLFQRFTVIHISRREHEVEYFSLIIDDQVQLKAEEPSHGTLSTLRKAFKGLMYEDALVAAHTQRCGTHKADAGQAPNKTFLIKRGVVTGLPFPVLQNDYMTHILEKDVSNVCRHILGNNA